jgi:peptidoglycan/LPS O-acetylase OafA/YrhL
VELSFYLFLPLYAAALAWWSRRSRHRLRCEVLGVVGLVAGSVVWKAVTYLQPTRQQSGAGSWLPAQLDLFGFGMALAVASVWWSEHREEPAVLRRRWVPMASWAGALLAFWMVSTQAGLPRVPIYLSTLGQAVSRQWLYGLFAFLLILPAVFGPQDVGMVRRLLRSRVFVATGLVSYGIYLWHETWITEARRWLHLALFNASFLQLTLIVVALSVASAAVSYVLVEQPMQRLGRRRPSASAITSYDADTGGRLSAHGRAASSWLASRMSTSSRP